MAKKKKKAEKPAPPVIRVGAPRRDRWTSSTPARRRKRPQPDSGDKANPRTFMSCNWKGCKITKPPAGYKIATPPGFDYTTKSKPCSTLPYTTKGGKEKGRKTCPVQLFFREGTPFIRFCRAGKRNEPGHAVEANDIDHAQKLATAACKCWTKSHKDPKKRSFKKCDVSKFGLGSAK